MIARRVAALVLILVLAFLCCGWGKSWRAIEHKAPHFTSIQASFTQEKHLKILAAPLISKGRFLFMSPGSLRWEYTSPIHSILLIHKGKSKRFVQGEGSHLVEEPGMNLDAMQFVMQEIGHWLEGRFTENPAFHAVLVPGKEIVLTPKEKGLSGLIGKIELIFSKQPGLIKEVVISEGPDSFTRLTFHDEVLNRTIPESLFQSP